MGSIEDDRRSENGARRLLIELIKSDIGKIMAAPILTLTQAATDRAKLLINQAGKPVEGIRVGVKTQGCSGYSYVVEYAEESEMDYLAFRGMCRIRRHQGFYRSNGDNVHPWVRDGLPNGPG